MDTPKRYMTWLETLVKSNGFFLGPLNYIFCDDTYLIRLNRKHLNHNTYTDIITFDYSSGRGVSGDIFISTERVLDNAERFKESFDRELKRVMAHGVLHLMGYGDKTDRQAAIMRKKEEEAINMFHVEQ